MNSIYGKTEAKIVQENPEVKDEGNKTKYFLQTDSMKDFDFLYLGQNMRLQ